METMESTRNSRKISNNLKIPHKFPRIQHVDHKTSIISVDKVVAIPLKLKESNLKLLSINQCKPFELNGHKQFDLALLKGTFDEKDTLSKAINLSNVTVLSLRQCGLVSLSSVIGTLPLKELDLCYNSFHHVPESLYTGLEQLETLDLSYNQIKDFNLPPKCLPVLKVLNLNDCKMSNMPIWILEMKAINLETLCYNCNENKILERKDYPQMPVKIKCLTFNNSRLRQNMLPFFKTFYLLQHLEISNSPNQLKNVNIIDNVNELFENVCWWRHIEVLQLIDLGMIELSEDLCKLVQLRKLIVSRNSLFKVPANVCNLTKLEVLDISENLIVSLPDLSGFSKLCELHAAKNHITTISIVNQHLKYVDLYDNDLDSLELNAPSIECIDLDLNYIDVEELANNENYVEKRDKLRESESNLALKWRGTGRKLDPFSSSSSRSSMSDEYNSQDLENYGCEDSYKIAQCQDNDSNSDWGEPGTDDLVTFSDSEYIKEEIVSRNEVGVESPLCDTQVAILSNDYEDLFIDAD